MTTGEAHEAIRSGRADCTCSAEARGYVIYDEMTGSPWLEYGHNHKHSMHIRGCPWLTAAELIYKLERANGS
jgi:hypothetical protein